ncbi:MAG: HAD family hydrolase [Verrucomicrobiota bacterium]
MESEPTLIFDADDTLWHNMNLFVDTHERYAKLLDPYFPDAAALEEHLNETERKNIEHFGYGVKGFTLSMIETAVEVTRGQVSGAAVKEMIQLGREMLDAPVELLPGVTETLQKLTQSHILGVITKGDLLNQEAKVARSGLAEYFDFVEVVSEKNPSTYEKVLAQHDLIAEEIIMIGNSLKSDITPILELGGRAVHIPYPVTWIHEHAELPEALERSEKFKSLSDMGGLVALLESWPKAVSQ